jgi:hypothetical protein
MRWATLEQRRQTRVRERLRRALRHQRDVCVAKRTYSLSGHDTRRLFEVHHLIVACAVPAATLVSACRKCAFFADQCLGAGIRGQTEFQVFSSEKT